MTHARTGMALLILLGGMASAAAADVVYLKNGGKIEGRISEKTHTALTIDVGAGSITLPLSVVERVERGRSALDDYDDRMAALAGDDVDGWLALARWASGESLGTQSLDAYEHVLRLDPDNAEANRAMGRVEFNGRWMSEEEAYRARGYVRFEGRWISAEEQQAILRDRRTQAELSRARMEVLAAAHQAEARAREAEARAREAEARRQSAGVPIYWFPWVPHPKFPLKHPDRPMPKPDSSR